jgi:hypothetical protein
MKKLLTLLLVLCCLTLSAQEPRYSDIEKKALVNLYSQLLIYPHEKVYLQTDRPYYVSGEKIWFRAFALHASTLTPTASSRYVYVELISPVDTVVLRSQIRMDTLKMFYGALTLPESLPEGEYRIRAYTRYMENTGEAYFYSRPVYIADPNSAKVETEVKFDYGQNDRIGLNLNFRNAQTKEILRSPKVELSQGNTPLHKTLTSDKDGLITDNFEVKQDPASRTVLINYKDGHNSFGKYIRIPQEDTKPDISFYPEGGNLLAGQPNRVAFKALLPNGNPAVLKGTVYNSKDIAQATFATLHDGMGAFTLQPQVGETYYAHYEYEGLSAEVKLPNSQTDICGLQTRWKGDSLKVRVNKSGTVSNSENYYLLMHYQGVPFYFHAWDFSKQELSFSNEKFPTGVIHFLLLTHDFKPVSERLVFNNRSDEDTLQIHSDKSRYAMREKVLLDISLPEGAKDSIPATFAISVTDDKDVKLDTTTNLRAEILLSSELEGHIAYPAWYFGTDKEVKEAADLLMLTHGWRRYNVVEALQGKLQKPTIMPETSQSLSGVLKKPTGRVYPTGKIQIAAVGYKYSEATESDEQGRFEFNEFEFPEGTAYQFVSYTKEKTDEIEVCPDAISYPKVSIPWVYNQENIANQLATQQGKTEFNDYVIKANRKYTIENGTRRIDLPELTVKARKKEQVKRFDNKTDALREPDKCISVEDIIRETPASFDDLFMRIPGVQEITEKGVMFLHGPAKIVLNDMAIEYQDLGPRVHISDIAQVDVYSGYGVTKWNVPSVGSYTAIILTTWPPGYNPYEKKMTNIRNVIPLGYQIPVEFYSPKYDTPDMRNSPKADLRSTIYWKPNLLLNRNKSTPVEFYTADSPTTYSVVVEGIGTGRKLMYYRKKGLIKVEK